jgi:hypothetical protein
LCATPPIDPKRFHLNEAGMGLAAVVVPMRMSGGFSAARSQHAVAAASVMVPFGTELHWEDQRRSWAACLDEPGC